MSRDQVVHATAHLSAGRVSHGVIGRWNETNVRIARA